MKVKKRVSMDACIHFVSLKAKIGWPGSLCFRAINGWTDIECLFSQLLSP